MVEGELLLPYAKQNLIAEVYESALVLSEEGSREVWLDMLFKILLPELW